ncbi:MAG TPA: dienelactone hydrolase family protein [Acidimicrobiales bacterium]|nr:dienelactone hydrolase family protein [Acidimicrobiales bacterium]
MPTTAEITIDTDDGAMPAFEAVPDTDAKGAVIVVQEAFGVTTHIEDVARRLADDGWRAVAPAFFHRQGSPVLAYDDFAKVMPVMGQVTKEGLTTDLLASLEYLDAAGFAASRTGVVGFCMGGTVSFYAGTLRPLGAAATFYGGGVTEGRFGLPPLVELAAELQSPWIGFFGDLDPSIPVEGVEALRTATAQAGVPTEIVRYADANHGFHCNDREAVYHPTAAHDAWQRTLEWFDQHLSA